MIVAGVDEAGYGPLLGPLVVSATAVRLAGDMGEGEKVPDIWKLLRSAVSQKRDSKGRKLHIADSKQVYSPSSGVGSLERGVLAFAAAAGIDTSSLEAIIHAVDPAAAGHLARHPWYSCGETEVFPLVTSAASMGPTANGLKAACKAGGVDIVSLASRVTPEGRYNELVGQTRNKASALFSLAASLLDDLLERHGGADGGLLIVCDRQGGREHYGEPLRMMFPSWHLIVHVETPALARYELRRGSERAIVIFREKGETLCLPTALASMLCKYVRESLMARFNAYWGRLVPGIAPTAGYYSDGVRFLGDIDETRRGLGVDDLLLVRQR